MPTNDKMRFKDRAEAGRELGSALLSYKTQRPIVLALARGGVPVAAEVAMQLGAPLDILLVRKIGAPAQPELALGAVVDGGSPVIVRNADIIRLVRVSETQFRALCDRELAEIERRRKRFVGTRKPLSAEGRVTITIDDGIATGATMRAALRATRMHNPETLVLAVPVASAETLEELRDEVDDIVCLERPEHFEAVGYFYADFHQLTDDDVTRILAQFPAEPAG